MLNCLQNGTFSKSNEEELQESELINTDFNNWNLFY